MEDLHTIAIVGGGVSGSLTALNLVRLGVGSRVVLIDPARKPGLGLAYSTPSMEHLLNVPAGKISVFPDKPGHFLEWLRTRYGSSVSAEEFAPRAVFGQYVQSLLERTSRIEHIRSTAIGCWLADGKATLKLAAGSYLRANAVVLATGNYPSAELPGIHQSAKAAGIYAHSPWDKAAYASLAASAPVTLIGSGLTSVDALLLLRERGHRGPITMMSRNGFLPRRHAPYQPLPACIIEGAAPKSAWELLHTVHLAIKSGLPWRAVIDSLRERTNELWQALPLEEQRRFRRHLQRRWETVRHRMAPAVADRIEKELAAGSLEVISGKLLAVDCCAGGASVTIRRKQESTRVWRASRVINCTGPNMDYTRVGSPLLDSLFEQGIITPGPLRCGLWSNEKGALRAEDGTCSSVLFNIGPGRQGMLLESIAVPELRTQAAGLAAVLSAQAGAPISGSIRQLMTID
ncbi:MAG TPA: FAD/NAD(P)-binding protein [Bryobacteraceae bacterium]